MTELRKTKTCLTDQWTKMNKKKGYKKQEKRGKGEGGRGVGRKEEGLGGGKREG